MKRASTSGLTVNSNHPDFLFTLQIHTRSPRFIDQFNDSPHRFHGRTDLEPHPVSIKNSEEAVQRLWKHVVIVTDF